MAHPSSGPAEPGDPTGDESSPEGAGPGVDAEGTDQRSLAEWAALVRQKVDGHKAYPYAARSRGLEGRVTVAFSVNPGGGLAGEPRVTASSGYAALDRAALGAVVQAAPFAPGPDQKVQDLELTLVFTLR